MLESQRLPGGGRVTIRPTETPTEAYERGWREAIDTLTNPDDIDRAGLAERVAGLTRTSFKYLDEMGGALQAITREQERVAAAFERHQKWTVELDNARAAIRRVRDLCARANSMTGCPFDDIEDPTPIPGWTTLVLRALDGESASPEVTE